MLGAAVLVGMVCAVYVPATQCGFIWDDDAHVTKSTLLQNLEGLGKIWLNPKSLPQYYPLTHTTFWIEYQLWGLEPLGYHVVNVVLHALAAVLVWRVLKRLNLPGAWLAAAIFAVHPVHVESAAWITERKNVLSMVFYLLTALAFLRFGPVEGEPRRAWRWYAPMLLLFICTLLSKTVTATLPAALWVIVWWKRGRIGWRDVWPLLPMFVLGVASGILTAWTERFHVGADGQEWDLSLLQRGLIAGRALVFYVAELAWPQNLTFIYPRWEVDPGAWWQYLYPAAVVAVIVGLVLLRRRLGRGPLASALFFAGTLFPVLGFLNVYPFRYAFVADHFQYHAGLGLIALGAAAAALGVRRLGEGGRRAGYAAAAVILAVLGVLSWSQTHMYKDLETLWTVSIRRNPACWLAYNNQGVARYAQGRVNESSALLGTAVSLNPRDAEFRLNYGRVLEKQGRVAEAKTQFLEALRLDPEHRDAADSHNVVGDLALRQGLAEEAFTHFDNAVRLKPVFPEARNNLALALVALGRFQEAERHAVLAVQQKPAYPEGHNTLGIACARQGRPAEAIAHFSQSARLNPRNPEVLCNLGVALAVDRRPGEALPYLASAAQIAPGNPRFRLELGRALASLGRLDEAMAQFAEVLRTDSYQADAYYQMGLVWQQRGQDAKAIQCLSESLRRRPDVPAAMHDLARLLATCPDDALRRGAEAVRLAERVCELTSRREPTALDTLAAAYAEAGRFSEAVAAAREAAALAASLGQKELAADIEKRRSLYEAGHPYREAKPDAGAAEPPKSSAGTSSK